MPLMLTLAPYQERAAEWMRTQLRGIVQIPAGGGKTVTAAAALSRHAHDWWLDRPMRIGWLAPTVETRQQAIRALVQFPNLTAHDVKVHCISRRVDLSDRDILIVDECKHATAPSWRRIIEPCVTRFGLDATPLSGNKPRDSALLALFGNLLFKVDRAEVRDRLVRGRVVMLQASDDVRKSIDDAIPKIYERRKRFWKGTDYDLRAQVAWHVCADLGITRNHARNAAIIGLARRHAQDQTLILVNTIEHGAELAHEIGLTARLVHAKLPRKHREEALDAVRDGRCRCLIATSLADEGLDLPSLNVLILASGGRSRIKAEQRTGRVLRAFGEKEHGLIYDFLDTQHPLMAAHSRERVKLYKSLEYEVTL
jgi:superfamily II DNA or RNA helicase